MCASFLVTLKFLLSDPPYQLLSYTYRKSKWVGGGTGDPRRLKVGRRKRRRKKEKD
jgi:hypothetical protein